MEIEIGELTFSSKRAAAEHFRAMLYRYEIGEDIPEPDATALRWLLTHHPECEANIGCGVATFAVRHAVHATRCFEVIRSDGSSTDFSYLTCIKGMAPSALTQALQAMRAAVIDDIAEAKRALFRESCGIVECAVTGEPISLEEARADHAPPKTLRALAIAFLEARGIDPGAFITDSEDNQYETRIVDPELAAAWRAYHHRLAAIRIVSRGAHRLAQGSGRAADRQLVLPAEAA
jgi:hypothetical protein